jgi:signal peptidase II
MQKFHRPRDKWRDVVFGSIVLLVVIADQLTKIWIRANLEVGQTLFNTGIFRIIRIYNTGAAFGIFRDHNLTLIIVDFIGIAVILFFVLFMRHRWHFLNDMLVRAGIGLILGGTIGNLIDRLFIGYVTDFIDFKVWPVWNVADNMVVIGTIIVAYCIIFRAGLVKHKE